MSKRVLITDRLRMDMVDFWEKVESGGFEYQDEDMNIAKEIARLHPNIHFGRKCTSQGDCSCTEYVQVKIKDLKMWREEWLEENDPKDGTDCVTPFDKYLY